MKSEVTITLTHEMKQLVADYMQEPDIADETQAVTMALHDAFVPYDKLFHRTFTRGNDEFVELDSTDDDIMRAVPMSQYLEVLSFDPSDYINI